MYEVEIKVRADHGRVRERLDAVGAERGGGVRQSDTYYDAPHRDFAETDEALRIRREADANADGGDGADATGGTPGAGEGDAPGGETRITYKGPLVEAESKTREEHETGVADRAAAEGVLSGLGFDPVATVEKQRERYAVDGYTVTLDTVRDLGEFVEVERTVEEREVESAREGAYEVLDRLGLDPGAQIRTSYLGLLFDPSDPERTSASDAGSDSDSSE